MAEKLKYTHRNGESTEPEVGGYYWVTFEDGDYIKRTVVMWWGHQYGWQWNHDWHGEPLAIYGPIPHPE